MFSLNTFKAMHCFLKISNKAVIYSMAGQPVRVLFYLLLAGGVVSGFTPVTYPVSSECGQYDPLQDQHLMETLEQVQQQLDCHPSKNRSCQEILHCFPSAPSGYYQIRVPNGSLVQVYCDMEGTNCGGQGGWTRIAYLNMSQSEATCPQGLTQMITSGVTYCQNSNVGCQGTTFSSLGLNYTRVCGRLRVYQRGVPTAFGPYLQDKSLTVSDGYVNGASITYGTKHIWTCATGINLRYEANRGFECPCNTGTTAMTPPYVGSDYYCETGNNEVGTITGAIQVSDPLWDGQQCPGEEAPCCTHPNMPWFNKTLSETTTENIQVKLSLASCGTLYRREGCGDRGRSASNEGLAHIVNIHDIH